MENLLFLGVPILKHIRVLTLTVLQDLVTELKQGLGLQWELLIKEVLEDRGFADAMAVFDAMCVSIFLSSVLFIL